MKTIKFYTDVLRSLGLTIKKDGRIFVGDKVKKIGGKPLVLPTEDNIANLSEYNEKTQSYEPKYELFHPLRENIVRDNKSLLGLKRDMELKINNLAITIVWLLAKAVENNITDLPLSVVTFMSKIKVNSKVVKKVDKKFMDFLAANRNSMFNGDLCIIKLFVPKGIKYKGGTVNRALTMSSPLHDAISEDDFKHTYRLDGKHVAVIRGIVEFILGDMLKDNVIAFSNNGEVPAPIVVLEGYSIIINKLNGMLSDLDDIDHELVEDAKVEIYYNPDDIFKLDNLDTMVPETGDVAGADNDRQAPVVDVEAAMVDDDRKHVSARPYEAQHIAFVDENTPRRGGYDRCDQGNSYNRGYRDDARYAPQRQQQHTASGNRVAIPLGYDQPPAHYQQQRPREVDYFTELLRYGDRMSSEERNYMYSMLSPRDKDEFNNQMERQLRDNQQGYHASPDRR